MEKNGKYVLFIDEIHTLVGAGTTTGNSMDAANIIKPALQAGKIKCIGSTTFSNIVPILKKIEHYKKISKNWYSGTFYWWSL